MFQPTAALATAALSLAGPYEDHGFDREIVFPDAPNGMKLLTADLHTHTVFSDGQVWPSVRVEEADRDNLDALALTEHLEHQPKKEDIPHGDRNRSYEVARADAENRDITDVIVINGAEITRGMPPGHVNAVFIKDANALLEDDARAAIEEANDQGAFVFWNHPNWLPQAPDGVAKMTDFHRDLIAEGKLHGVEVANGTLDAYSEDALGIALEYDLTILGTSDIHGLVDWTHHGAHGGHRPMTIVLAEEKSADALQDALFDGRTVAWSYDDLIGKAEHVEQVVRACLNFEPGEPLREGSSVIAVTLKNACPLAFTLQNTGARTLHNFSDLIRVERYSSIELHVRMNEERHELRFDMDVLNTQIAPRENLSIRFRQRLP